MCSHQRPESGHSQLPGESHKGLESKQRSSGRCRLCWGLLLANKAGSQGKELERGRENKGSQNGPSTLRASSDVKTKEAPFTPRGCGKADDSHR